MKEVNILGCGVMGSQISALLSYLGWNVTILSHNESAEQRVNKSCKMLMRSFPKREHFGEISIVSNPKLLVPQLTIEAVAEDILIKKGVIDSLDYSPSNFTVLTNCSAIEPSSIHSSIGALHFFNPIRLVPLVEYYWTSDSLPEDFRALLDDLSLIELSVVETNGNPGFIGNHLLFTLLGEIFYLVEKKDYTLSKLTEVLPHLGIKISPAELLDLVGVEVVYSIMQNLSESTGRVYVPNLVKEALDKQILGKKNGTSFKKFLQERSA